jgi:hypothetical protein
MAKRDRKLDKELSLKKKKETEISYMRGLVHSLISSKTMGKLWREA